MVNRKRMSAIGPIVWTYSEGGRRYTVSGGTTTSSSNESEVVGTKRVPKWVEMTTTGGAGPDMHVRVEVRDGSPQVVELGWIARPGEREIRRKDLQVDLAKLAIDLYASAFEERHPFPKGPDGSYPDDSQIDKWISEVKRSRQAARNFVERQRRPREHRAINDDLLKEVAEVYRANIGNRAPTQAVANHFGVGNRMASTYLTKARDKGFLPKTRRGKKQA